LAVAVSVAGKRVVVTGDLAALLRERGADAVTVDLLDGADHRCDISDASAVSSTFTAIGTIDGLVNCAAILPERKPSDELTVDEWDRLFEVNVRGSFLCARAAAGQMPTGGSIVNVASETAFTGSQGFTHYVASKGAIVSLTRALANEYGERNIRVNCVAPGYTPTPGSAHLGPYDPARTPLGRVMVPADLLGTFCYLLSDDSAFVSGQTTLVNGGRVPY
jgi:3-oxoacyl-[acyl-carrier protein] reductase